MAEKKIKKEKELEYQIRGELIVGRM